VHTGFGRETWGRGTTWKNIGVDLRIILKCILKRSGGIGWVWLSIGKDGGFF